MPDFDTVVIGNGLFGSAAARHLAAFGERVALVGPDEPTEQSEHDGVFASHYDQGRLTRLLDRNPVWAGLTRRAVENYPALEKRSGIDFYYPVGSLIVGPRTQPEATDDPVKRATEDGIEIELYEPGDRSWKERFPYLSFADDQFVVFEPAPAGFINPRRLIGAQNALAVAGGAVIIRELVTRTARAQGGHTVTTDSGRTLSCSKLLVAAGGFTNFNGLLPEELPLTLETEVVVLGRVADETATTLEGSPTVKYTIDHPILDSIYVVPPVRFPDGSHYIKLGANTTSDRYPSTLREVQDWFRQGDSDIHLPSFESVLQEMWPNTEFESFETKRCLVCRTPSTDPIIDRVGDGIFVVVGGNGGGAKGSDVWGELAAGLAYDGRWPTALQRFPRNFVG